MTKHKYDGTISKQINCLRIKEKNEVSIMDSNSMKIKRKLKKKTRGERSWRRKNKKNNKVSSIFSYGTTQVRSVESQKRNKRIAHNSFL